MSESLLFAMAAGGAGWAVYFGAFGWYAASRAGGEPIAGAVMGVLGGPMGVVLAAVLPRGKPAAAVAPRVVPPPAPRPSRKLMGEVPG